jgi:multicomponent Na+:H+ antiporter subunit D
MDIQKTLASLYLIFPIVVIILSNILFGTKRRKARRIIVIIYSAVQSASAVISFILLTLSGKQKYDFSLLTSNSGQTYFALNPVGLLIIFCAGIVCLASELIGSTTIKYRTNSYTNLLMVLMLSVTGIVVSTDLFSLYAFMELSGISSFVMIAIYREDTSLEGAFKYMVLSCIAGVMILTSLSLVFMMTGSLQLYDLDMVKIAASSNSATILTYVSAALLVSGFCIKAGVAPFHNWLPDAYQSADPAISVLLSGIVNKAAGIYGIMVVSKLFSNLKGFNEALICAGIFSIALGALLALRQNHFKRIAAYSSVSQMGYIVLGFGAGTALGLIGAAAHIFSHTMFKSTLFTNSAALKEKTGILDVNKLGGLQKQMPVTSFTSVIAFLSAAGIPPLSGFWSKLTIVLALFISGNQAAAVIALLLSILTGAYFLRMQRKVFFGKPKSEFSDVKEIGGGIKAAEIILTVFTILGGLVYPFILTFIGLS